MKNFINVRDKNDNTYLVNTKHILIFERISRDRIKIILQNYNIVIVYPSYETLLGQLT